MNKNVVITGSTRGIGLEMAKKFLQAGCNVTLSGRHEAMPQGNKTSILNYKDNYIYTQCNVQKQSDLQNLWDESSQKWGKVDIWINNAGQNSPYKFAWETSESYTQNIVATNIVGMILGCQVAAKNMIAQKHGAIYSMEGLGSNNMIQSKTILYGTTKHALTYFMKGLAKELEGSGIIAGRLSPGMMLTDFITKTPEGEPSEVLSDESFRKIFNILADKPETVATFFIPKMLSNKKNNVQIIWLTNLKAAIRFMTAPFNKRKLL